MQSIFHVIEHRAIQHWHNFSLHFDEDYNSISCPGGKGKTYLFNHMRSELLDVFSTQLEFEGDRKELQHFAPLIFIGDMGDDLKKFNKQSSLKELMDHLGIEDYEIDELSKQFNHYMKRLFRCYIRWHEPVSLDCTLDRDGTVTIRDKERGYEINDIFQAAGRQIVTAYAIQLALRSHLEVDVPLVIDVGGLNCLDQSLLEPLWQELICSSFQLIVFAAPSLWRNLMIKPDLKFEISET